MVLYYNSSEYTNIYIQKAVVELMEKDIDRISKNPETDIVIRIDDFGGKRGLTIREFVRSERYTGFTKAGTRIPADKFKVFKDAINSIDVSDLETDDQETLDVDEQKSSGQKGIKGRFGDKENKSPKSSSERISDIEEQEM